MSIGNYVFDYCSEDLVLTVPRDSWAKGWCVEKGLRYTYPDALDWLKP